jgi:hypothetical protein
MRRFVPMSGKKNDVCPITRVKPGPPIVPIYPGPENLKYWDFLSEEIWQFLSDFLGQPHQKAQICPKLGVSITKVIFFAPAMHNHYFKAKYMATGQ